jgi:hypothetical protein
MTRRVEYRGRNQWQRNGRPPGQLPHYVAIRRRFAPLNELALVAAIALIIGCAFYFGGHFLLTWSYGAL